MHSTDISPQPSFLEWLVTHPPMAGADGEGEAEVEVDFDDALASITATEAEPGVAADAASGPDPLEELGSPFRLSDVPEGIRPDVERYVKQVHGAFTKKTQDLAEQRSQVEQLSQLQAGLDSDDPRVRDEAMQRLVTQYGYEWEAGEEPDGTAARDEDAAFAASSDIEARLAAMEQRDEARAAEARESDQAEYVAEVREHLTAGYEKLKAELGLKANQELPPEIKDYFDAKVRTTAPIDGLWPDVDKAVESYTAFARAAGVKYAASKRAPDVDASGSSGVPKFDATREDQRLAAAQAIAGRHLA